MLDSTSITALGPGLAVLVMLGIAGIQAWVGSKGKDSAYPPRDEKHDANVGAQRETQQLVESSTRLIERHLDSQDGDLSQIKVLLEIIKDRTQR